MRVEKPSIPKGTRDFGPSTMIKRKFILNAIESVFKKYGFLPLETPTMENLSVLMGKYGDEGDQLIFKILNSGNYLEKTTISEKEDAKRLTPKISEKGLRYDLTVPFARFVVMNRNDLQLPFRRYQIQPVWRADRPQKGRYREFYQCDADVVGTDSLLCEAEIIAMIHEVFSKLNLKEYAIKINNRKILSGIVEKIDQIGRETDLCVAIDKLDKVGKELVLEELKIKNFSDSSLQKLDPIFGLTGNNKDKLSFLKEYLHGSEIGLKGIAEMEDILSISQSLSGNHEQVEIDITLARGLSYYTGAIFEIKALGVSIGSISGGGRYDDLTGVFGLPGISGVGISFGIDRIYDVMEDLGLFPDQKTVSTKLLICHIDKSSFDFALPLVTNFRNAGINTELYPDLTKLKKQLSYANSKGIPFVIILGSEETGSGNLTLKNMTTGEQVTGTWVDLITKLNDN